ncbi:MAG TPA: four-carbon acid sugar kinase family protein [Chloroflexota bacterium]|nr:four-carbon acid sugar kinase family protein [Chloroflexota bacterium]
MQLDLAILADDLTGAADTGLQLAKRGYRTHVSFAVPAPADADVLVIDTDSRICPAPEAARRVATAARWLRTVEPRYVYKKIDSTGRGNLGAEIEAALGALGISCALVCPAFPAVGRTVRDGRILIHGVSLDRTEFADDPLWPAATASIADLLRAQTDAATACLPLAVIRQGCDAVRAWLARVRQSGVRVVIADAETDADLQCLAALASAAGPDLLLVGSAGLAAWLMPDRDRTAVPRSPITLAAGPILIVAGTLNRRGIEQIRYIVGQGACYVPLDLEHLRASSDKAIIEMARDLRTMLGRADHVVLGLVDRLDEPFDARRLVKAWGADPIEIARRLVAALGQVTRRAIEERPPAALVLTGGDTARAVVLALGAGGIEIREEVAPGVPAGIIEQGPWHGLPLVTKAGGFGPPEALAVVLERLEERRR